MTPLIGSVVFKYTPPWSLHETPMKVVYGPDNIWESLIYPDLSVVKNKQLEPELDDDIAKFRVPGSDGYVEIARFT